MTITAIYRCVLNGSSNANQKAYRWHGLTIQGILVFFNCAALLIKWGKTNRQQNSKCAVHTSHLFLYCHPIIHLPSSNLVYTLKHIQLVSFRLEPRSATLHLFSTLQWLLALLILQPEIIIVYHHHHHRHHCTVMLCHSQYQYEVHGMHLFTHVSVLISAFTLNAVHKLFPDAFIQFLSCRLWMKISAHHKISC